MSDSAPVSSPAPAAAPAESASPVESNSNTGLQNTQAQTGQPDNKVIEDIQEAVESGELSPVEANKMLKKFQIKVDGKTMEREIDLSDEEAVRNELQLAAAAKRRMQESAELKKAYQREMERLKSDPWSVLQELGLDPEEMSTGYISKKIEEMKKSPEQLAQEKLQKELEEARAEAKRLKEERETIEMQKLQEQAITQINDEIDKAISGHKKLPNTDLVRKKIADSMLWAMNNGFPDITADEVVPLVEKEMREELNKLYESLDDDALADYIGKKNVDRMRKKRLAASKVPGLGDVKPTSASVIPKEEPRSAQKIKAKDLFRQLGRK